jgi:undecaprenyl-diphosphatase
MGEKMSTILRWQRILLITLCLIIFLFFGLLVSFYGVMDFDLAVSSFIYELRTPFLNSLMEIITLSANWQSITFFCLVFLLIPFTRKTIGLPVAFFCLSSSILNKILKNIFETERPLEVYNLIHASSFSFPSGHSMTGLLFYSLMIIVIRRYKVKSRLYANIATSLLVLLIILIGFSRVYLGVHYPTDVIAGFSMGLVLTLLFEPATDGFSRKHIRN